jgi:hypothetical protein
MNRRKHKRERQKVKDLLTKANREKSSDPTEFPNAKLLTGFLEGPRNVQHRNPKRH